MKISCYKRSVNRSFFTSLFLLISVFLTSACAHGPAKPIETEIKSFQETVNLQHYVLLNYHGISQDILIGDGDYLQAFFDVANIPEVSRQTLVPALRKLIVHHPIRYDFAIQSELLLKRFQSHQKSNLPLFV